MKTLSTLFLVALLASVNCQCNWTVEVPQRQTTPLHSLAITDVICHNHIMVLYDTTIEFPFATYAIHTQEQMGRLMGGRKSFVPDPVISLDKQHLENDTIFHYPYSRGHLTPSHIMSYDKSPGGPWEECYYMSNILPQIASLNEGPWEKLEANVIKTLTNKPSGTVWETYTGGFWNGKYSITYNILKNKQVIKDYLFWKAFCDRKRCSSGMITAFNHNGDIKWNVHSINSLIPGIFAKCCPDNSKLDEWSSLLEGVTESFWHN